jgi:hypothetical protein
MKEIFLALGLLGAINAFADTQFICNFGSEVRLSKPDLDNPSPVVDKKFSRYTFIVNKAGTAGSYVNLKHGQVLPIVVHFNGNTITFIEKNTSNNLFIVTAFLDRQSNGSVPAVFNQNGWTVKKDEPEFQPYTSLGSCAMTSK